MTNTTSNSAASLQQTNVAGGIVQKIRDYAFLVNTLYWEPYRGGSAVVLPRVSSSSTHTSITSGTAEADALTPQEYTTSSLTLTPAVKANAFLWSQYMEDTSSVDLPASIQIEAAQALIVALEVSIATLFAGLPDNGTTGVALSVGTLDAALTALAITALEHKHKAIVVLHPKSFGDLRAEAISGTGSSAASVFVAGTRNVLDIFGGAGAAPSAMQAGLRGWYANTPIFESANVQKINTNADYSGAAYCVSPGLTDRYAAFAGSMMWMPTVERFNQGSNHIIGSSMLGKIAYNVGEYTEALGEEIISGV